MVNTFSTTGGMAHSTAVSGLANGGNYNYYVRCQDASGNANPDDFAITFSVGVPADPASSSFVGVESPLSEGGMWDTPGAWGSMAKNSGAYGPATDMAGLTTVVSADQFSEITFDPTPLGSSWVGVTTRIQGAKNGSCYLAIAYAGGVWLYRTDDSGSLSWTQLASAGVDITVAPRRLRLE